MGYFGKLELKQQAQQMRKSGKSYSEIILKLHLSKSTVSDWCRDIILTKKQIIHLYESKKSGALKGSYIAAKNKIKQRIQRTNESYQSGMSEIGHMSKRDKFITGIALYAAEGTKIDKGCCISNSDPSIIRFMTEWFHIFGGVGKEKFRGAIWLHEGLDENIAKQFWSQITGIPEHHFYKTYIAKDKINSKKIRKNKHQYGIFSLYVNNTALLRKIMGWIAGTIEKPYNTKVH
jgi:hypothetical protein